MSNMKVYPSIFAFLAISVILVTTAAPDTGKNTWINFHIRHAIHSLSLITSIQN